MAFRETLERVNNSPRLRMFNRTVSAAALGVTVRNYRKNPNVWTALAMLRVSIALAETFKPRATE